MSLNWLTTGSPQNIIYIDGPYIKKRHTNIEDKYRLTYRYSKKF